MVKDKGVLKCTQCGGALQRRKKRWGLWLILIGMILIIGSAFYYLDNDDTELETVVLGELKALKENHITEAYYHYASKGFQEHVTLENFRQWIETYPILTHFQDVQFGQQVIQGNEGAIKGILLGNDNKLVTIETHLVKEVDEWKISKILVNEDVSAIALSTKETAPTTLSHDIKEPLEGPIDGQLQALKQGNISAAYLEFTTDEFRKISLEDFTIYIQQYPIFMSENKVEILKNKFENSEKEILVLLESEKESAKVGYILAKENDQWKIRNFGVIDYFRNFDLQIEDVNKFLAVVERQLHAFKDKDINAAYKEYTSKHYRKMLSLDSFQKIIEGIPVLTRFQGTNLISVVLKNGGVLVQVELFDVNGEVAIIEYTLGIEDGSWKIWHFKMYFQSDSIGGDEGEIVQKNAPNRELSIQPS